MKRRKFLAVTWLMTIVALSFLLSGCATGTPSGPSQAATPGNVENLLIQAGFKAFPDGTPQCQRICAKLPPEQLVPHKKGNKTVYAYYSPKNRLLYGGDEAAYQRFINLAVVQKIEERHRPLANERTDPEFWTMWESSQGGGG